MTQQFPQCENLQEQVDTLLNLLHQEPSLRAEDTTSVQTSLRKAISPTFEIVFAGAFSAGKSMLINALLERELLYSAEGHATGTECYIAYAEPGKEEVVLTFLSEVEIRKQAEMLCQRLGIGAPGNINQAETIHHLLVGCSTIIEQEGGESRSERAKQAKSLSYLLEGLNANRDRIHTTNNNRVSMAQFNFTNLQEAADYARRGKNSAVLKKIEYYCTHPLLEGGNVIIDTPGIDAPVREDALVAYHKIENLDTSAVVCIFKTAATGELTAEETELIERTQHSPNIRDRVFNIFNRVDETWYNGQLRQRLDSHIKSQFRDTRRVYQTSGLLGFYGSQIKGTSQSDRFGLDSIFSESVKGLNGKEETPQFVNEFIRYCLISEKLPPSKFPIVLDPREAPTNNEKYVRVLKDFGNPLIEQLIQDSGIDEFRTAITRYLTEEKRPQLFATLADDLQQVCITLKKHYQSMQQELDSQPREIEQMKERELQRLNQDLNLIGASFKQHIEDELSDVVGGKNSEFNEDFQKLKARMVSRLDELLNTFSVETVHNLAIRSHRRNTVVPLLSILAEAFYYLANGLEDVLVASAEELVTNFFRRLIERVRKADYYGKLYSFLGNDGGIEETLNRLEEQVIHTLVKEAQTECDRYVRELPEFYKETTCSMWQLRETLQQTCRSYSYESMKEAEPAIRQLLKLDFDPKVSQTINRIFRQTINQTLNMHLSPYADRQSKEMVQHSDRARAYLGQTLAKEAEEKIKQNQSSLKDVEQKIEVYNQVITGINSCLAAMQLDRHKLPPIEKIDLVPVSLEHTPEQFNLDGTPVIETVRVEL